MTRRLLNISHVVAQAIVKSPAPCWVKDLPWETEAPPAAKTQCEGEDTYIYGFDDVSRKVWRRKKSETGKKFKDPEFAMEVTRPPQAADSDPVMASWADGSQCIIEDVMCIEYETMGKRCSQAPAEAWTGELLSNHNKISVCKQQDR